jgi:hypothetical protein
MCADAEKVVSKVGAESLHVYGFLQERFSQKRDVTKDHLFQFIFRSFYRLDNAGLGEPFKEKFFLLLEENRNTPRPDPNALTMELYGIPTLRGLKSVQFSFG